ncbi:MAG: peptide chain release factor N(5)-glutamine methyltransferase [Phycisphaerae bacterium]|nr:peptide chain release factor N(5)-glutamine methyltransferase [Phycisphaerae bacterium]
MADHRVQQQPENAWTVGRLLAWTKDHFEANGVDEPRLSAELLLAQAMDCRRIDLYARFGEEPKAEQRATFREMVRAAGEHKPISHLIGHKEFYSLEFKVTPNVLIPRPETELLVERVLAWCDAHERDRCNLLDVGTGSGCIAIAVARRRPGVRVVACDISDDALAVAAENAERHGVAERMRCVRADLLDLPAEAVPEGGFDVIVSNPPYVAEDEWDSLPENVRKYEPEIALLGGTGGLEVFRRIAGGVRNCLQPDGTVILEVGFAQADAVEEILTQTAGLQLVGRFKDLGGVDRALQFTLSGAGQPAFS